MNIQTLVDRWTNFVQNGAQPMALRATRFKSLATAAIEFPQEETARTGRLFHGGTNIIANGIAPVAAIPTTTATLALCNTDAAGGRSLVLDHLAVFLGSGTPAAGLTLFAAVGTVAAANFPAKGAAQATGYNVASTRGQTTNSVAVWQTALTLQVNPGWSAILSTFQTAAANVGQGDNIAELRGSIIVPPQSCLALGILSGAGTTPLYGVSARWAERELDIET